jgi:HTH-type transcriptional regulator/antitoxin HigA
MRNYRTFSEIEEEYFRKHPEEIDDYLAMIFEEYAKDDDIGALLSSLRTVSRAKGITTIAEETGMTRKGVQKALSEHGNPKFESINAIMQAMGYRLTPQKWR